VATYAVDIGFAKRFQQKEAADLTTATVTPVMVVASLHDNSEGLLL
jgi:hypothetical protein